ncbi:MULTISPECIES: PLP-dependent aminotransferase family protein [Lysinibacillus]|jgi:2-aminoadipate transaminase|uniref:PLP-dependent aminotransferase family protein n=1 Tax=Lysinibacillus fusiformis TaxID=28031 RepID=A0A2I0V0J3_9BACI|nr:MULTISPECIES: PLP-dependent aminotransferase family protein [Lysinibacillus]MEE3806134.1 PLP-dependent aminotransferase family protein [Lysinibacillus fusiformis]PKU51837.1 PLP-dependent aminotransferase family protein [Lysinibacillus fusiformis]SCZ06792.1 2-aminoadipate transaminase [Lysinibacillus sp. SG9]SDB52128.1 2-aminoadipate transaminase [Lysinibacillus sp. TC-37]SFT16341.1 2-aminoadipate transaminase [Lysinibacillus sp. SG55]
MQYSERILKTPSSFIRNILKVTDAEDVISFAGGLPNPISFPIDALRASVDHAITENGSRLFQYSSTQGYAPLREYIAAKYQRVHGLDVQAEDVFITTGSQQALELISKVLINKGDGIIIEEPGYLGAIQAFTLSEPTFYGVTLENDGLNLEELERALQQPNVKFIYTVPNFQNPTGLTYSKEKREHICEIVAKYDVALIEDDPYGELRFQGEPLPYIGAGKLDNSILLGSFSKTVTPGMRLGFIITKNKELLQHIETAKQASDLHTNIFSQYIIYDYLASNDYSEHVKKIITLYKNQSEAMLDAMQEFFPAHVEYTKPEGGMFIWATMKDGTSALDVFQKAMEQKVAFVPGDPFYTSKTNVNTMRLNYTNATPEVIREGIKRLASIL